MSYPGASDLTSTPLVELPMPFGLGRFPCLTLRKTLAMNCSTFLRLPIPVTLTALPKMVCPGTPLRHSRRQRVAPKSLQIYGLIPCSPPTKLLRQNLKASPCRTILQMTPAKRSMLSLLSRSPPTARPNVRPEHELPPLTCLNSPIVRKCGPSLSPPTK